MSEFHVGPEIKKYMKNHGIKQRFLAQKMSIPESSLAQKLKGSLRIDTTEFFQMCEILDVSPDFFQPKKSRFTEEEKV